MDNDSQQPAAVPVTERIASLDFVRGIAVMGILFANIAAFGQPMSAAFYPGAFLTPAGAGDDWLWLAQLVLIDGKMRGLFTLLFGAGLVLFMERAWDKGAGAGLQLRRLFWLGCFGIAHYVLLWRGDILFTYALGGAAALIFVHWSGRRLLAFSLAAYVAGALLSALLYGFLAVIGGADAAADPQLVGMRNEAVVLGEDALAEDFAHGTVISNGDYLGFAADNLSQLSDFVANSALLIPLETLPLILLGMALYKLGFFRGDGSRRMFWWSVAGVLAGAVVTLALGLREIGGGLTYWSSLAAVAGWGALPRLPMILGLAGLLMLLNAKARGWAGEGIRAAGRAAFTNYVGTSFVMLWLFHGFGLGLFGELGRVQLYVIALVVALLMPVWSKAWLARYRYGPLEWLWRCLTYGRRFALRRQSVTE